MLVKEVMEKIKYPIQISIQYNQENLHCCCFDSEYYTKEHSRIIKKYGDKEVLSLDIMDNCGKYYEPDNLGYNCLIIEIK